MTTHTAHFGFSFNNRLRSALHLPRRAAPSASGLVGPRQGRTDWLERLADWSDRHPPSHHRMGSYLSLR